MNSFFSKALSAAILLSVFQISCGNIKAAKKESSQNLSIESVMDTQWRLSSVSVSNGAPTYPGNSRAFIQFNSNGDVNGHDSCNQFSGDLARTSSNRYRVENIYGTLIACSNNQIQILFGRFLQSPFSVVVEGNVLTLRGSISGSQAEIDFSR